jgi:hypothetical protein
MALKNMLMRLIWCTGFKASLDHLRSLGVVEQHNSVDVKDGISVKRPNLWLVGYGDWTRMASATLIGFSRTARAIVEDIEDYLAES